MMCHNIMRVGTLSRLLVFTTRIRQRISYPVCLSLAMTRVHDSDPIVVLLRTGPLIDYISMHVSNIEYQNSSNKTVP